MAERRMFAKTIVLSDAFLDMPLSARCLYFTLGMLADDDGFINSPKSIMRQCGASNDDMNILLAKKFLIPFESGVCVIKHWRINNYLRSDRYTETKYVEEKQQLFLEENGGYTVGIPSGIPSIDKDRLGYEERKKEIYKENIITRTHGEEDFKTHEDIMREWGLSDGLIDSLKSFLRHCYLNKHIVTNEKLNDIILRLVDKFSNDQAAMIECIERAIRGGYLDVKA